MYVCVLMHMRRSLDENDGAASNSKMRVKVGECRCGRKLEWGGVGYGWREEMKKCHSLSSKLNSLSSYSSAYSSSSSSPLLFPASVFLSHFFLLFLSLSKLPVSSDTLGPCCHARGRERGPPRVTRWDPHHHHHLLRCSFARCVERMEAEDRGEASCWRCRGGRACGPGSSPGSSRRCEESAQSLFFVK